MCHFQVKQTWAGEERKASEIYSSLRHYSNTFQQSTKTNKFLISRQIPRPMRMQRAKLIFLSGQIEIKHRLFRVAKFPDLAARRLFRSKNQTDHMPFLESD